MAGWDGMRLGGGQPLSFERISIPPFYSSSKILVNCLELRFANLPTADEETILTTPLGLSKSCGLPGGSSWERQGHATTCYLHILLFSILKAGMHIREVSRRYSSLGRYRVYLINT
jgi:hypothetical protein